MWFSMIFQIWPSLIKRGSKKWQGEGIRKKLKIKLSIFMSTLINFPKKSFSIVHLILYDKYSLSKLSAQPEILYVCKTFSNTLTH